MPCRCGRHQTPQGCAGATFLANLPAEQRKKKTGRKPRVYPRTGPLCACGCGRRCLKRARYASFACVPKSVRTNALRDGWAKASQRHRAIRFKKDIDRLLVDGKISRGELIAFAHEIYERGYHAAVQRQRRRQEAA